MRTSTGFSAESDGADRDENNAHYSQYQSLFPQVAEIGATKYDSAADVYQISSRDDSAEPLKDHRHVLDREDVA